VNIYEFVLGIILIVMVTGLVRTGIKNDNRRRRVEADPEADRLRDEVRTLKERLAVIERITVEKENSLEREIESLRDR
jgi:uncharacterized protein YlxW (UPF0749 family)